MTNEEQVLAAIEELANQLNDLKKTINRPINNVEVDLSPIGNKLDSIKEQLQKMGFAYGSKDSDSNRIFESLRNLQDLLVLKQREVVLRYIEVKQPRRWLIGFVIFFIVNISICFYVISRNIKLNKTIETIQHNDYKYRYLKLKGFEFSNLRSEITNTNQLVYYIDLYYKDSQNELVEFVLKREEELRQIFEASEIAKQKEFEAKKALDEAKKLKSKYSGNGQNK